PSSACPPAAPTVPHSLSLHDALPIYFLQLSCTISIEDGQLQYSFQGTNGGYPRRCAAVCSVVSAYTDSRQRPGPRCSLQFLLFIDRKSTRLNSSHQIISYAVFCLNTT